jgi:hypothetical protein
MMDLETLQRHLLSLIKNTEFTNEDDPYLYLVQHSKHLKVMRSIIFLWRAYEIEQYCIFTAALLKRKGLFDEAIQTFIKKTSISPFIEKLGPMFLEEMSNHSDTLIASLARFELALIRIKQGDATTYVIEWDYNPYHLIEELLHNTPLEELSRTDSFRTILSKDLPGLFQVLSLKE